MKSGTLKPFTTTNLVVFAPDNHSVDCDDTSFVASGDALIVDPGCHSNLHKEVRSYAENTALLILFTNEFELELSFAWPAKRKRVYSSKRAILCQCSSNL